MGTRIYGVHGCVVRISTVYGESIAFRRRVARHKTQFEKRALGTPLFAPITTTHPRECWESTDLHKLANSTYCFRAAAYTPAF